MGSVLGFGRHFPGYPCRPPDDAGESDLLAASPPSGNRGRGWNLDELGASFGLAAATGEECDLSTAALIARLNQNPL
jgi:hypothetical protein